MISFELFKAWTVAYSLYGIAYDPNPFFYRYLSFEREQCFSHKNMIWRLDEKFSV